LPIEHIEKSIQATTQFARTASHCPSRKHYRTRWPAANVDRQNKDVATDTFFSDAHAHDDGIFGHSGCTMAQIVHAGKRNSKTVVHGMKSESQMPNALEDLIHKHGALNCLFITQRCVIRLTFIKYFQCEREHQHQNSAKTQDRCLVCGSTVRCLQRF
jgi:hypothetical protein